MQRMTVASVARSTHARYDGLDDLDAVWVDSVEFDTRKVRAGTLFVALSGEHVDGHDFVEQAAAAGAVAVLASRPVTGPIPVLVVEPAGPVAESLPDPDDAGNVAVLAALADLAHASVLALPELTVIGITGSAGKTSTKDLVAAIAAAAGPTVAPPESFNNELGHPYTVLRADAQTRYLVLELSARGPGHIAMLARVAPPRIGVVLNVGTAHAGEFGSLDATARAKGELAEALAADGVAILNADDHRVAAMADRTMARVIAFGGDGQIRAEQLTLDGTARASFVLVTPVGNVPVTLAVAGEHQVGNALAAAAVGLEIGLSLEQIAEVLGATGPASKWRMDVQDRPDGVTVVNDAYNANPESMKAALKSLATIGEGRRTWAVLGEMAELGDLSRAAHDEIGRLVVRLGIDRLIAVGPAIRSLYLGAHLEGSWGGEAEHVADIDEALTILDRELVNGDVVLVKASRSVGLERVALALLDPARSVGAAEGDRR